MGKTTTGTSGTEACASIHLSLIHILWGYLPADKATDNNDNLLIKAAWPEYDTSKVYDDSVAKIETAKEIIKAIRNARTEVDAAPSRKLNLIIKTDTLNDTIEAVAAHIQKIANVVDIEIAETDAAAPDDAVSAVFSGGEILILSLIHI